MWIDPGQVPGLLPTRVGSSNLREALGWRGLPRPRAAASIASRSNRRGCFHRDERRGRCRETASLAGWAAEHRRRRSAPRPFRSGSKARRLALFIDLRRSGRRPDSSAAAGPVGTRLSVYPRKGQAVSLAVKIAGQGEKTIHFHAEYPWTPGSPVPIVALSRKTLQRGMIAVRTPVTFRANSSLPGFDFWTHPRARCRRSAR